MLKLYQAEDCPHSANVREAMQELGLTSARAGVCARDRAQARGRADAREGGERVQALAEAGEA